MKHIVYKCPFCSAGKVLTEPFGSALGESAIKCKLCRKVFFVTAALCDDGLVIVRVVTQQKPEELIMVRDSGNTYVATYGKKKASCTASARLAAEALARKLGTNAVVHFVLEQDRVEYYDLECDEVDAHEG